MGTQPKDFASFTDSRLCASPKWVVATHKEDLILGLVIEMKRRDMLTEDQIRGVHKNKATIGDSSCYMIATYGAPHKENITQTADAISIQNVYTRFANSDAYIYTKNGIITAIQY